MGLDTERAMLASYRAELEDRLARVVAETAELQKENANLVECYRRWKAYLGCNRS